MSHCLDVFTFLCVMFYCDVSINLYIMFDPETSLKVLCVYNHARICSLNQPVVSNEGNSSCQKLHREPFMEFELKPDSYTLIAIQTR